MVGVRNKGGLQRVRQFPGCFGVSEGAVGLSGAGVARTEGVEGGKSRGPRHDEASRRQ